uniref:Uncharacterized protein n=1 Tax=Arion vulgaris TaxID=1028688 RepID=A0A0B6Y5Y3_9EUPU
MDTLSEYSMKMSENKHWTEIHREREDEDSKENLIIGLEKLNIVWRTTRRSKL